MAKPRTRLGWREWVRLPELGDLWVEAKVDTGARSSSLHAYEMEAFERDGGPWLRFSTHRGKAEPRVEAPLIDHRGVKSSTGVSEDRPVIRTPMVLGGVERAIEVTLTRRDEMGFQMLLGREALRGAFEVDPGRSHLVGRPPADGERPGFPIGGVQVPAGKRQRVEVPISRLATGAQMSLPVLVLHGAAAGPSVWVDAGIHGDEIGGVEVIRRVLERLDPATLRGTVIVVPVVNVHGFVNGERYLPDRRDLNRSFPGSSKGSLARRIAHLFMTEVVARCTVGIDLHTGSDGRTNLPQVRADLSDPATARLARAFGAPVMVDASPRKGSLRRAASRAGATVLVYEGGEAWRFDPFAIEVGTLGILRVLAELDLIDEVVPPAPTALRADHSRWVRARRSGLAQLDCGLGDAVDKGQVLGRIHDSFGRGLATCRSPLAGVVIGLRVEPVVHRGDALIHLAPVTSEEPL